MQGNTEAAIGNFAWDNPDSLAAIAQVFEHNAPGEITEQWCFNRLYTAAVAQNWNRMRSALNIIEGNISDALGRCVYAVLIENCQYDAVKTIHRREKDLLPPLCNRSFLPTLHNAAAEGDIKMLSALKGIVEDINAHDAGGWSPLFHAIFWGRTQAVAALLQMNARPNLTCSYKSHSVSAVCFAAMMGRGECLQQLAAHHSVKLLKHKIETIGSLVHIAIYFGHSLFLAQLHRFFLGDFLKMLDSGKPPMLLAAEQGNMQALALLVRVGCRLDVVDRAERTPLHLAALGEHVEAVRYLLMMGADPDAIDLGRQAPRRLIETRTEFRARTICTLLDEYQEVRRNGRVNYAIQPPENLILTDLEPTALAGACRSLEDQYLSDHLVCVMGLGAGAIPAALLACGCSAEEICGLKDEPIENTVSQKTGIQNCTFGELKKLIRNDPIRFRHLHLIVETQEGNKLRIHSQSKQDDWDSFVISSVVEAIASRQESQLLCKNSTGSVTPYLHNTSADPVLPERPQEFFDRTALTASNLHAHCEFNTRTLCIAGFPSHPTDRGRVVRIPQGDDPFECALRATDAFLHEINPLDLTEIPIPSSGQICFNNVKRKLSPVQGIRRERLTAQIKEQLVPPEDWTANHPTKRVGLVGIGGSGKSELSRSLSEELREMFSLIFWIDCSSTKTMEISYETLVRDALKLPTPENANLETLQMLAHAHLSQCEKPLPWLLILDDVQTALSLPETGGFILANAQLREHFEEFNLFDVKGFDLVESRQLIVRRLGCTEAEADTLAAALDHFPLSLQIALGILIARPEMTIDHFLRDIGRHPEVVNAQGAIRHPLPFEEIWNKIETQIQEMRPEAMEALKRSAPFGAMGVPVNWLLLEGESEDELRDSIELLHNLNVVHYDPIDGRIAIHQRIQQQLLDDTALLQAMNIIHSKSSRLDPINPHLWLNAREWALHAEGLWRLIADKRINLDNNTRGEIACTIGEVMRVITMELSESILWYKQALKALSLSHGNEGLCPLAKYSMLLEWNEIHRQPVEVTAFRPSVGSLDLRGVPERYLRNLPHRGQNDLRIARCFQSLGIVEATLANDLEAEIALEASICIFERNYNGHPAIEVAFAYSIQGLAYDMQEEYQKSHQALEKSIEIWQVLGIDVHPQLAYAYNNMGKLAYNAFVMNQRPINLTTARNCMQKALDIRESLYPDESHPLLAHTCSNMAMLLAQEFPDQALDLLMRAWRILENVSQRSAYCLGVATKIAMHYMRVKRRADAYSWYLIAVEYAKEFFGLTAASPEQLAQLVPCYIPVINLSKELGEADREARYREELEPLIARIPDAAEVNTKIYIGLYLLCGQYFYDSKNYDESIRLFENGCTLARKIFGKNEKYWVMWALLKRAKLKAKMASCSVM